MGNFTKALKDIFGKQEEPIVLTPAEVEYIRKLRQAKMCREAELEKWKHGIELTDKEVLEFLNSPPL